MKLTCLLLLLPSLPLAAAETVLGAYIFHRHGDLFTSASWFRSRYVEANATSPIHGIAASVPVLSQLSVTSPVDDTLQNSAQMFLLGLYPPAGSASAQRLANGRSVEPPLGGYQAIPVNAVATAASSGGAEDKTWLQGGSNCGLAILSSNKYFSSVSYLETLESTQDFYRSLLPVYNSTFASSDASFKNAYAIYDYVHVSTIHNASGTMPANSLLTTDTLHQLQTRADQHEWALAYNSSEPVRAIAGAVLAGQVLEALEATLRAPASQASAQRLTMQFGAYATFMSFFGLAQAPAASPDFYGTVDYASSIVFELVTNATVGTAAVDPSDVHVRFLFANGSASDANPPRAFPLFGRPEITLPWANFSTSMSAFAVDDTLAWCAACGNTTGTCAGYSKSSWSPSGSSGTASAGSPGSSGGGGVSRPVAGVIGALATLVVILGVEAIVMAAAGLRLVRKRSSLGQMESPGPATARSKAW
ncbi:hypothetical protein P8C59_006748 [Phyllachora maydis]|uniref:Histidine acid phosphatase n=1 Tax=Phyllachora maydis TaxID=1825666 RepID=A0AAD9MH52_9PEZI|nr:hypothetical protein P8C59_006748 [Phyllachora maydis]